jgi:uncharacterized protein
MSNPKIPLVVLDTNVLLVSVSSRSKYHWLYQSLLEGKYKLAITQSILFEYEEQLSIHWNKEVALNVIRSITELPNTTFTTIHYHLNLIVTDEDDNKFVDCAFAANANLIVTHDHHFNILKEVPFPVIPVVDVNRFEEILYNKDEEF